MKVQYIHMGVPVQKKEWPKPEPYDFSCGSVAVPFKKQLNLGFGVASPDNSVCLSVWRSI